MRLVAVLLTLYVFIIALDLMSTGFRICLGLQISQLFRSEAILQSPITGLVIGMIVTVVVQSSSASTSIVVSLVASGSNYLFSSFSSLPHITILKIILYQTVLFDFFSYSGGQICHSDYHGRQHRHFGHKHSSGSHPSGT